MSGASDTIAAIATAPGRGGIAVLRISGPRALPLLRTLFRPPAADFTFIPRYLHYGLALDCQGLALDEVLAVFMPGPRSFTGEDTGEIHCHGGPAVSAALLEAALAAGARHAGPGEFTRRAFLNGRLDLTQAEAVAELIAANSLEGARLARARLQGHLGAEIAALRSSLDALRTQVALAVDFAEEEAELLPRPAFARVLAEAELRINSLLKAYGRARFWREGALAVLAGRVNAGKSSLLNALLGRERAIVSASPGTTRDYIEEELNLAGLPLRLIDTAGLRQSGDIIENEGMRLACDLAERADLVLLVCDLGLELQERGAAAPDPDVEVEFLRKHPQLLTSGRLLMVMNKADKAAPPVSIQGASPRSACVPPVSDPPHSAPPAQDMNPAKAMANVLARRLLVKAGLQDDEMGGQDPSCPVFAVSAASGFMLDELAKGVRDRLLRGGAANLASGGATAIAAGESGGGDIAPNLRQSQLLRQSLVELEALGLALKAGHPPDILAVHLDAAAHLLDEISGASSNEDLLNAIFSSFCIGK